MNTTDKSLLQTILSLLDVLSSHKTEGQSWIHLLSLLCIFTILNQPSPSPAAASPSANPLQKLLGDLVKGAGSGGGGAIGAGGADTLLSLLPLLNNPQLKSKLNPANIAAVMNIVQNLTGSAPPSANKPTASAPAAEPQAASIAPAAEPPTPVPPAAPPPAPPKPNPSPNGRYLDWKSSF